MNRNDYKSPSQVNRPPSSIGWKKELHMREPVEIIEDELIITQRMRESYLKLIDRLREMSAPDILIEDAIAKSKMTIQERSIYDGEQRVLREVYVKEYAKKGMDERIVNKLYNKFDEMLNESYDEFMATSKIRFNIELNPLGGNIMMSKNDFYGCLYDPLIESLRLQYIDHFN